MNINPQKLLVIVVIALSAFFLARGFVIPEILSISEDFTYDADIVSLDNFYNPAENNFEGQTRSVTTFKYWVTKIEDEDAHISNIFDVRTVSGESIVKINRSYVVNRKTYQHNSDSDTKTREGFMFAPLRIKEGEGYKYWHVNYDQEINMLYRGVDYVDGLRVFKYESDFKVDQTNSLAHLEGVPDEFGVNLDVTIKIWIEPYSGWLIKYEDDAIAYYYDIETKRRIHPWNKFSNSYTDLSIENHVREASKRKNIVLVVELIIPLLLVVIISPFLLYYKNNKSIAYGFLLGGLLFVFVIGFLIINGNKISQNKSDSNILTIGVSRWVPDGNLAYDENIQGFKDALFEAGYREGIDVVYDIQTSNSSMVESKRVVDYFFKKNVDLLYSLTTPGTLALKEKFTNTPIIFSVVTYPVEAGIIESVQSSGNNLVGTRNWIPLKDQVFNFLKLAPNTKSVGFIRRKDEVNSFIQFSQMKEVLDNNGMTIVDIAVVSAEELKKRLNNEDFKVDALYSSCDTLVQGESEGVIIAFARENRIPSFSCNHSGVVKGDLIGTVADFYEIGRLAGEKAVLVLNGISPSALGTDTVTVPDIYINKKTAEYFGIDIPQELILKASKIVDE